MQIQMTICFQDDLSSVLFDEKVYYYLLSTRFKKGFLYIHGFIRFLW